MLVLSRKRNESVVIRVGGEAIKVTVVELRGDGKARLGFTASDYVVIDREEVDNIKHRPKEQP